VSQPLREWGREGRRCPIANQMEQAREAQAGVGLYEPGKSAETANSIVRLASASELAPLATIWLKLQCQNSPYIPKQQLV
jgi:hypothetical protein